MKIYLFIVVLQLNLFSTPVEEVRIQFPNIETLEETDAFLEVLKNESTPEGKGYIAAMLFMKSHFVKNPFSKFKYFKQGKQLLDNNINRNPSNIEIRYIRFIMQKQIPDFLGYSENITDDFNIITSNLKESSLPKSFKIEMLNNMLLVDNLTTEEQEKINQNKSQL